MSDFLAQSIEKANISRFQGQVEKTVNRAANLSASSLTQRAERPKTESEIEEVAKGFDAMFLRLLVKEMKKTVQKSSLMGEDSSAMQMYDDLLDEHLSDAMADQGLGIGDMVRKQLKEHVENVHEADSEVIRDRIAQGLRKAAEYGKQSAAVKPEESTEPPLRPNRKAETGD